MHPNFQPQVSNPALNLLLTNLVIYCSQYPYEKPYSLLRDVLKHENLIIDNSQTVISTLTSLFMDLTQQLVHGPSGSYVPAGQKPHRQYLDEGCIFEGHQTSQSNVQSLGQFLKQWGLHKYIEQTKIRELLWYNKETFLKMGKFINKKISKSMRNKLQIDGEIWNDAVHMPTFLFTLKVTIEQVIKKVEISFPQFIPNQYKMLYLVYGRLCFLYNKILKNPVKTLYDVVIVSYRKFLSMLKAQKVNDGNKLNDHSRKQYISVLLEYMLALTFYYKYKEAENILQYCKNLANIQLEYTGKLGRRTKYQTFDTAQLIMNFKTSPKQGEEQIQNQQNHQEQLEEGEYKVEDDLFDIPSAFDLVNSQLQTSENQEQKIAIEYSKFDEESILLEKPKLMEEEAQHEKKVKVDDIILLIGLGEIQYRYKTTPKDQVLYQQISTALSEMLSYGSSVSYPMLFNMLFLRSDNQFDRVKNAERSIQQFEILKSEYNEKPLSQKNPTYLFSTDYKIYLEFISHLADKYLGLGMVMTAVDLYERVGMFEECIDGLIARNYRDKAKQKIFTIFNRSCNSLQIVQDYSLIDKHNPNKTPRLLCMLGDIYQHSDKKISLQLYEEAWQLSNNKFARAQRSIGWHFYNLKEYQKAASAFKQATNISYYNPNTWFTLGCCYMNIKQFQKALPAFSQSISIDSSQGEAWGNISSCYIYLNKFKEAYSTLEQGVRCSQRNWKLWANLLSVSLKIKKFYKYFHCIQILANLQKYDIINFEVLYKISIIFKHYMDTAPTKHSVNAMKNRIDRLFSLLVPKIGQHPHLWRAIYQYNIQLEHFVIANYQYYSKIYAEGNIQQYKNDILQGYDNPQSLKHFVNIQLYQLYDNIVDSKLKELNMAMKVGWDSSKNLSETVLQNVQQYIWVWNKYATKINSNQVEDIEQKHNKIEHQIFIEGIRKKLEHCLERKLQIVPKQP